MYTSGKVLWLLFISGMSAELIWRTDRQMFCLLPDLSGSFA